MKESFRYLYYVWDYRDCERALFYLVLALPDEPTDWWLIEAIEPLKHRVNQRIRSKHEPHQGRKSRRK